MNHIAKNMIFFHSLRSFRGSQLQGLEFLLEAVRQDQSLGLEASLVVLTVL